VWQGKDLRDAVFGCVASKGVTGEILDVWQIKELEKKWRVASDEWREKTGKAREADGGRLRVSEKRAGSRRRMATGRRRFETK